MPSGEATSQRHRYGRPGVTLPRRDEWHCPSNRKLAEERLDPSRSAAVIAYKYGQEDEGERVTTGGFSSKRLARVREVLSRHLDAGYVPGAVAVVARHGEVHIEATGTLA